MNTDHKGYCECPLLRYVAEIERLAKSGIVAEESAGGMFGGGDMSHLVIAALRERYGCRGPHANQCYWKVYGADVKLKVRDDVPLIRRKTDDLPVPGNYQ